MSECSEQIDPMVLLYPTFTVESPNISRPNKVIIMIRLCMIAFLKVVGLFKIKSV